MSSSLGTQSAIEDWCANILRRASCRFYHTLDELDGYSKRWLQIIPYRIARTLSRIGRPVSYLSQVGLHAHGSEAVPQGQWFSKNESGPSTHVAMAEHINGFPNQQICAAHLKRVATRMSELWTARGGQGTGGLTPRRSPEFCVVRGNVRQENERVALDSESQVTGRALQGS